MAPRAVIVALVLLMPAQAGAQSRVEPVPRPACRPGDLVETALQGQVPIADRRSGRAAMGYACNLVEVGGVGSVRDDPTHSRLAAWANFDVYEHCAYYGDGSGGTVVIDVADPAHPVQTARLEGGAMSNPWESLRVNARRGLLVADHQPSAAEGAGYDPPGTSPLDVYDVSKDCAHPRKLFSGSLPNVVGHEGFFAPDGMVYYATNPNGTVVPVDLSDPARPRELAVWSIPAHGGSISDDGKRGYFCANVANTEVWVLDTSEVQARKANAKFSEIARVPLPDTQACQETYPITYEGRPHLVQFGEWGESFSTACPTRLSTHSRPHIIDIADERNPRVVATLMNEVALPENCAAVAGDRSVPHNANSLQPYSGFSYGSHMCHPDRLHDPTILACAEWLSGIRVYDIRDPRDVRELAYFNPGTLSPTDEVVDMAAARPVIRPDRGEIWFATVFGGFRVLRFAAGVYPFGASLRCAEDADRFVEQYGACAVAGPAPAAPAPRCAPRRTLTIRLRTSGLRSLRVYVNRRRVRARRRGPSTVVVDVRRLKAQRLRVKIVARSRRGRRVVEARTYRRCAGQAAISRQASSASRQRARPRLMCRLPFT